MIEPIFRVGEKLGNTLYDFCGITSDVQFILPIFARPFPNLIEHFAVKRADVELLSGLVDVMVLLLNAHSLACRMFKTSYSFSSPIVLI